MEGPRIIVTDLDGTLLDAQSRLSAANRSSLEALGSRGIIRVVATGRSLYSARKVMDESFPIDYLVFSTGAGTMSWRSQTMVAAHHMSQSDGGRAIEALLAADLPFMIHRPIPDNHVFEFHPTNGETPDFERRIDRYREYASSWDGVCPSRLCQLLAVENHDSATSYDELARRLAPLSVIRTTSPLDHRSRWIEIFPQGVSKAHAAAAVAAIHGCDARHTAAIGNDFNDHDLLEWAADSRVVSNAPSELRAVYAQVASHDDDGFSQFAEELLARSHSASNSH